MGDNKNAKIHKPQVILDQAEYDALINYHEKSGKFLVITICILVTLLLAFISGAIILYFSRHPSSTETFHHNYQYHQPIY